jgi:cell surface protein SprA
MRLVGSRWVKRRVDGVLSGIGGDEVAVGGRLEISPVSAVSEGDAYQAPPGVLEQLDDPTSAISGRGVEFNEKSLAIRYTGLAGGNRGEVYYRFLQRPRNFLAYGELRFWAVSRESTQGDTPTDFFLKVGSDAENFYLYRFPLEPVTDPEGVLPQDWLPERAVHFDQWIELRRVAEQLLLTRQPFPGAPPVEVWSVDSTYAVVLEDRARAPNLAAVREISIGVWNPSEALPADGEVWVNELRLSSGVRTLGTARVLSVDMQGGGLLDFRLDYSGTGPHFQQLQESPTYQGDNEIVLSGGAHLGAAVPAEWGWSVPLSLSYRKASSPPNQTSSVRPTVS